MLAVPSALAVITARRDLTFWITMVFILFVFLIGFRFNVGMDWSNYESAHASISRQPLLDMLLHPEPASNLLFWVSANLGLGSLLSNVVAASILMVGVLSFARQTRNPWIAVVAATPYLIIAFGMSGIRQAMASGIVLFALANWDRPTLIGKSAWMIVASLFHTSALLGVLLVLWETHIRLTYKIALAVIVSGAVYFVSGIADLYEGNWQFYQDAYLGGVGSIASPGALFHIALIALPAAIFVLNRRKISALLPCSHLLWSGVWMTGAVAILFTVSTTAASRLTLYLYFVPMLTYAALPAIVTRQHRDAIVGGILLFHFAVLASWLFFANNSSAHIPYRNLLFQ